MKFINVADLVDPTDPQGRSYREINNAKSHKFKVGDLVEIDGGVRLFIAKQTRDCDGTPLYCLTHEVLGEFPYDQRYWFYGICEDGMTLVTTEHHEYE